VEDVAVTPPASEAEEVERCATLLRATERIEKYGIPPRARLLDRAVDAGEILVDDAPAPRFRCPTRKFHLAAGSPTDSPT